MLSLYFGQHVWSRPPQDTRTPFSSATKAPGPGVGGVSHLSHHPVCSQDHSHSLFPPGAQGLPRGGSFAGLVGPSLESSAASLQRELSSPWYPAGLTRPLPTGPGVSSPKRDLGWEGRVSESEESTPMPASPRPGCEHALEVLTAIRIHDLAHVLSLLRINMNPFFRMKFHGFIFPPS